MNEVLLEIEGLNKYYEKMKALDQVNLQLESGKIVGLLGPNGSGKTTLIKIINGLLASYEGNVKIVGKKLVKVVNKLFLIYLTNRILKIGCISKMRLTYSMICMRILI